MADGRLLWLDAIRVAAAQLIVLHHLSLYGPIARASALALPGMMGWLEDYGRMAVQVFLVIGGFLFASGWGQARPVGSQSVFTALWRRWRRLFPPFYAALVLVLIAAIPGRAWVGEAWVPQWPDLLTVMAHATGLYDYLGVEALSAGAWYVTIDLQLHALALGMVWLASCVSRTMAGRRRVFLLMVAALAGVSLLWVNRRAEWDFQPVYFFGSFALGVAAQRLGRGAGPDDRIAALLILALAAIALLIDWRLRIAISLVCALILVAGVRGAADWVGRGLRRLSPGPIAKARYLLSYLADISYALFLVHFSACVLVNALFVRFTDQAPGWAVVFFVLAWAVSIPLAAALHRWIEQSPRHRKGSHGSPNAG